MAENDQKVENTQVLGKKISAITWGAFFIWMGVAFLTNISWGMGLLGVGVIVLGAEAAGKYLGFPLDWFWLVIGILFTVWGICESLKIPLSGMVWPILSIVVGLAILFTALRPHPRH